MVTTFLVTADFRKSAKRLNRSHLNKQRTEAYQILNNILDLYHFGEKLGRPLPQDQARWKAWIKLVVSAYEQWDYCYIYFHGIRFAILRTQIPPGFTYSRPFRKVGFGFVYHTAVLMWLGWPDALKAYLNAHIDEWVSRGYANEIEKYDLPDQIDYPPWIDDPLFHQKQKAALVAKEIAAERDGKRRSADEKVWYRGKEDFMVAYQAEQKILKKKYTKLERPDYEYFWPSPDAWRVDHD